MPTVETHGGEFKDPGGGTCGPQAAVPSGGGRALVLPAAVLAYLAGQLVARARAGEPVALTGRGC